MQPFPCKLNDTVQIGRTKANALPASVSRAAIDATAKLETGVSVLHIAVRSTVYLRKSADPSKVTAHKAGEQLTVSASMPWVQMRTVLAYLAGIRISGRPSLQLGIGDQLFLGKAEDANGFVVQVAPLNCASACVRVTKMLQDMQP